MRLFETHDVHISFSQKGKMYLELYESGIDSIEKTMILKEPQYEDTNLETECLLQNVPIQLWALSSIDFGTIKLATPIK